MISIPRRARSLSLAGLALAMVAVSSPPVAGAQTVPEFGGRPCTIVGTEGDDVLYGTPDRDIICGLGGNDTIWAGAGDDDIDGGPGDDRIGAGAGNDIVHAGDGADTVWGSDGVDVLQGGLGPDHLWGGDGIDFIAADEFVDQTEEDPTPRWDRDTDANVLGGGAGSRDFLYGADGPDRLYAGAGGGFEEWDGVDSADGGLLFGFGGDDLLVGRPGPVPVAIYHGPGDDRVYANGGAVVVMGSSEDSGDDVIHGSPYDDVIIDFSGSNRVIGGDGDDVIAAGGQDSDGPNIAYGGNGDDEIYLDGVGSVAYGGAGNDRLDGGSRGDRLIGGAGDDELVGGDGDDVLIGQGGADRLVGGTGNDTLWAGSDDDVDELYGGFEGADSFGTDIDRCSGGPGDIIDCAVIR